VTTTKGTNKKVVVAQDASNKRVSKKKLIMDQ
jgi:hypothetical protein